MMAVGGAETTALAVGQRCEILSTGTGLRASLKRYGQVAFLGEVAALPAGEWVGVRLDKPLGKNDGTADGVRYFECAPLHGAFVRRDKVNTRGDFPVLETQGESISHAAEEQRRALQAKRQQERASRADQSTDELQQSFWKRFLEHEDRVRRHVSAFVDQKKQPTPCDPAQEVKLDEQVLLIHAMRDEAATAASLYLSPYDIRHTQLIISKLLELIETTRTTFAPRKKFTFKARARKAAAAAPQESDETSNNDISDPSKVDATRTAVGDVFAKSTDQYVNLNELAFADRQNEVIVIDDTTFAGDDDPDTRRDLNFSRLVNCVIVVAVETSAIRGDDLKNCVVYAGPVWGSLWLEHCQNCDFFVACRQLRVHLSATTTFHLRIASHPIIEDCNQLRFGPYRLQYPALDEQLQRAGLHRDNGLWAKVNDFKWHKAQQSPNWGLWDPKNSLREIPAPVRHLVRYE